MREHFSIWRVEFHTVAFLLKETQRHSKYSSQDIRLIFFWFFDICNIYLLVFNKTVIEYDPIDINITITAATTKILCVKQNISNLIKYTIWDDHQIKI